jgi:hypothetical protein
VVALARGCQNNVAIAVERVFELPQYIAQLLPQRMSLVLGFKHLRPPARVAGYAPPQHRAICSRIHDQLRVPVEFREPGSAEGPGQVSVKYFHELQEATIQVERVGAETAAEILRSRRFPRETSRAKAVFLGLRLAQAGTPELCRAVEQEGFFFSRIGPCFGMGLSAFDDHAYPNGLNSFIVVPGRRRNQCDCA